MRAGVPPGIPFPAEGGAHVASAMPVESQQHAAFGRAQALLRQQFGLEACATRMRDDELLLDSGATYHFSGRREGIRLLDKPIDIWTAVGPTQFTEQTQICNGQLAAPLEACYSEGAPDAAALGKLIREYKLHYSWSYDDFDHPLLIDSLGNKFRVRVAAGCPILCRSSPSAQLAVADTLDRPHVETVGPVGLTCAGNMAGLDQASHVSNHPPGDRAIRQNGTAATSPVGPIGCAATSQVGPIGCTYQGGELVPPGVDVVPDGTDTFMMDEPEIASRILGIQIEDLGSEGTISAKTIKQSEYCQHVVGAFQKLEQTQTNLRAFNTPAAESDLDSLGTQKSSSVRGRRAAAAAMLIGTLLYLMRGMRPDLAVTTSVLRMLHELREHQ